MMHTEQIEVYKHTRVPNATAGAYPGTPERQIDAPTWATVKPTSGYDLQMSNTAKTEGLYTIIVNYRPGFTWDRKMFITTRFGNMDIYNIFEDTRKRTIKLMGVHIAGVSSSGEGPGGGAGGQIKTLYQNATGGTSISIPSLAGTSILLAFRDGIGKKVVTTAPTQPNEMQVISGGGFQLMSEDLFGEGELITVLYKTV